MGIGFSKYIVLVDINFLILHSMLRETGIYVDILEMLFGTEFVEGNFVIVNNTFMYSIYISDSNMYRNM